MLLILACAVGVAHLVQQSTLAQIQGQRDEANRVAEGELARTEAGVLGPRQGVVILGAPAGARPAVAAQLPATRPTRATASRLAPQPGESSAQPGEPQHYRVGAGESLSKIAQRFYGRHDEALLTALASFNGLSNPSQLRADAELKLPPLERLLPAAR